MSKPLTILIAGGTGFIGSHLIRRFKEHTFINISHTRGSELTRNNVAVDLQGEIDFLTFTRPVDMVINCIDTPCGQGREDLRQAHVNATRTLVAYAKKRKVPKFLHFSVNSRDYAADDYMTAKLLAEKVVEDSGLDYIIFKPSVVFGGDSRLDLLLGALAKKRLVPELAGDEVKFSPVHIDDLLANVAYAFTHDDCWMESYPVCGPEYMSFREMVRRYASEKIRFLRLPKALEKRLLRLFLKDPELKAENLIRWIRNDNMRYRPPLVPPKKFY